MLLTSPNALGVIVGIQIPSLPSTLSHTQGHRGFTRVHLARLLDYTPCDHSRMAIIEPIATVTLITACDIKNDSSSLTYCPLLLLYMTCMQW